MKYNKLEESVITLNKISKSLRVIMDNDTIEIHEFVFMKKSAKLALILVLHLMIFVMFLNVLESWIYFAIFIVIQLVILKNQLVSAFNSGKKMIISVSKGALKMIENGKTIEVNNLNEISCISAHMIEHRLVSNWGTVYSKDMEYKLKIDLKNDLIYTIGDMNDQQITFFLKMFKVLLNEIQQISKK